MATTNSTIEKIAPMFTDLLIKKIECLKTDWQKPCIPMIFNNLVGKNLKGREYSDYIAFVAIPDMGFTYGKIAYYSDGNLIATGEITP